LTARRSRRRLITFIVLGLLVGLGAMFFVRLGSLLRQIDPPQKVDVVYVLGGAILDRSLEAVELYREGYTPHIILSPEKRTSTEIRLAALGIHLPTAPEIARDVIVTKLGVPASAIEILPGDVDNTAQEAEAIRPYLASRGWKRMIVITGCPNSRRAGYAVRRAIGSAAEVFVRCNRLETYDAAHWWRTRVDFRETFYEAPKLLAYLLGLKG
jgi:uncharacterized SAM-binding protein YcdF (DUF218 family)